ncbi:GTSE1 protein, partial [Rhinopomastus cyanomelas]|nr:GTSE1 protein [Rhinopomastus cyanomelas]
MEEGREMMMGCSSYVIEEKQSISTSNTSDFPLLIDEEFDFDLSLSAASENEDEVFIGPLGHKEKCISANIEAKECDAKQSAPVFDDKLMWSPLAGEKYVEIYKEAHLLALQIETGRKNEQTKKSQSREKENKIVEKFVEDSKSKLKILRNENIDRSPRSPRAIKRETYCVWENQPCQLPPCFQKELNKPVLDETHILHTPPNRSPVKIHVSPTNIASAPLTQEQTTKERNMKAPNKLPMIKPSSNIRKSKLLNIEKPNPGKHSSMSTKRDLSSFGSSEELTSDKSSAASDVFESSFSGNSLAQDKKALPAPQKLGLKKLTHLKFPGVASGLMKKTTTASSSSSVSSMNSSLNSSLPISPIGKSGKSSMSLKPTVKGSKLSSGTNRLALVRPTKVSSMQAANAEKLRDQARSASTPKISSTVSLIKSSASATTTEAVGSAIQRLSSVPSLQEVCQQDKDGSAIKGSLCPKPKARVLSVPASQTKVPVKTEGTPLSKPASQATPSRGRASCGTLGSAMAVSTPMKASEDGVFQNPCFPERSVFKTPASLRRSGLPTPIRRVSGFSAGAPNTAPRLAFSPHAASGHQRRSFSARRTSTAGPKETEESKAQIFSEDETSPPPVQPLALNFSPEKTSTEAVENKLTEPVVQNQLTEGKQAEDLLIDIGVEQSLPQRLECERPLIDLSNTPEVNNITPLKPTFSGQVKLIDLSSPLITLSPDVNKENLDSPLLKF